MPLVTPSAGSKQVASVHVDIGADTTKFEKGSASVLSGLGKMAAQFLTSAAVVDGFRRALVFSIQSAAEAERVDAQLGAVLRSTGGAAGMARGELDDLANSLSRVSTYDDEAIKSSEALLLTFTEIGSDVFPTATQAILDMSTAMGTDLQSATIQVGKALNDPINGITALSRVGVSFTQQQKEQIKAFVETGNSMKAQKIILDELSKEFGGSALAASKTYEGQLIILKNEFGNVAEEIGVQLIPRLTDLSHAMVENMDTFRNDRKEMNDFTEFMNYPISTIIKWTVGIDENAESASDAEQATKNFGEAAALAAEQQKANAEAVRELQEANQSLVDGAIDITERNKDYEKSQQDILDRIAETRAEGEKLYPWEHEKIQENIDKLDELGEKYFENRDKFMEAQNEKLAMMAIEQIALSDGIEGFSQAEYEKAKVILETQDIATAAAFEEQQAMTLLAQAVADGIIPVEEWGSVLETVMSDGVVSVEEVNAAINAVPKENTVTFNIVTNGQPPNLDPTAAKAPVGTHRSSGGRASGGGVNAGAMYEVLERGVPELLMFGGKQMLMMPQNSGGFVSPLTAQNTQSNGFSPSDMNRLISTMQSNKTDERKLARYIVNAMAQGG